MRRSIISLPLISVCISLVLVTGGAPIAPAQHRLPVLITEDNSMRAMAFDFLTRRREPFSLKSELPFSADARTRVMLLAMHLPVPAGGDVSGFKADAQDGSGRFYDLEVEQVMSVPREPWLTAIIVRLHDDMKDVGDVLMRVTFHGISTNRVRVGIGRTGGGMPDDAGAQPVTGKVPELPPAQANDPNAPRAGTLTTTDVRLLIAQAVAAASSLSRNVTIAVVDREGNPLGVFTMPGAPSMTRFNGGSGQQLTPNALGFVPVGLNGARAPSSFAALSKAGTAAFFSTAGNAFTTRTAGFIIQEHFPPSIEFRPGGPLYGVQFSSLRCSDIKLPGLPLGVSGDPGGLPIYKNGVAVGGIGIEGDGLYTVDRDPRDFDQPIEEIIAASAVRGFEPPALIRGDNILVDGVRLPYTNVGAPLTPPTLPFDDLPGQINPIFPIREAQLSDFAAATVGGIPGQISNRFFPFRDSLSTSSNRLTAADVNTIISQAAQQSNVTRAAIRQPLGSNARVSISVVDAQGRVLGIFRTEDAPVFGFDVAVQKARSAAFFTRADAGASLRAAGFGTYVERALADSVALDGKLAFSNRTIGFLHRPFFPDGIDFTTPGPFSTPINEWSVFNVGLQLDIAKRRIEASLLSGGAPPCTPIPGLENGLQIFAGSVPVYKNDEFVGAIGISGDGIDQDDIIAAAGGSRGYGAPASLRADQIFVREVRLPFVKFPRSPNL